MGSCLQQWMGTTDRVDEVVDWDMLICCFKQSVGSSLLGAEGCLRSGSHLSPLALESTDSLLPPFGSHLERAAVRSDIGIFQGKEYGNRSSRKRIQASERIKSEMGGE